LGKRLDKSTFSEFDPKVNILEVNYKNKEDKEGDPEYKLNPANNTRNQEDIKT
jgi:hypothetical protein